MRQIVLRCLFGKHWQNRCDPSVHPLLKALSKTPPLAPPSGLESLNEETGQGGDFKNMWNGFSGNLCLRMSLEALSPGAETARGAGGRGMCSAMCAHEQQHWRVALRVARS